MSPSTLLDRLAKKPQNLFLIDSLGALLTAFLLIVVLRNFHEFFGASPETLTFLSAIAGMFCIYSASCFFLLKANEVPFIRAIGMANLGYCLLTLVLVFNPNSGLTLFGKLYFLGEISLVIMLVYIELAVARMIKQNNHRG